ncbi:MAG: hypothetical protein VYA34_05455 [Myxococcota bacterium]|nr:hypothetical protein [Myxococcota bacterium]
MAVTARCLCSRVCFAEFKSDFPARYYTKQPFTISKAWSATPDTLYYRDMNLLILGNTFLQRDFEDLGHHVEYCNHHAGSPLKTPRSHVLPSI